jgi:catechol 2,3-dioxygenase-like lactoylglutathione lyase family enzyme
MTQIAEGPCRSDGWNEAVVSVIDLDAAERLYREVAGWEVVHRGRARPEQARAWLLGNEVAIDEVVLANPGEERRHVRLVRFHGVPQRQIRSSGRFWDVGGISNLSSRVADMQATFGALQERGWVGHHDPVTYQFGPFTVIEVAATGHDGVVFSLVERLAPRLGPGGLAGHFTAPFNAPQIVSDFEGTREFYLGKLGFQEAINTEIRWQPPGANVFGLPYKLAMDSPVKVSIVHPQGAMRGSVELFGPGDLVGRDFGAHARPPNLGILMLRFPVAGIEAYVERLTARGVALHAALAEFVVEPYGRVRTMAVLSPNGSWLEFYEA